LAGCSHVEKLTSGIRKVALDSGADLVGIVSAEMIDASPRVWVGWKYQEYTKKTTDIIPDAKSVIVIGHHLWDDMLELAIRKDEIWVYPGYFPLRVSRLAVMNYLEKNGFKAVPADGISYKRLAQLAGLGNYGKNALIINSVFGPWIRIATVLTNATLVADKPFEQDLCGECEECVKSCPVSALVPYKVDDGKCLVGIHLLDKEGFERNREYENHEPSLTKNSHLMCMACQKACKYGLDRL
jgi:epoxyqueuosine reductase QueG